MITKEDEADVQRIVTTYRLAAQEPAIRKATSDWNAPRFLYALERLQIDLSFSERNSLVPLYQKLLSECLEREARTIAEQSASVRHGEITARLAELRKPHWTVLPNFWLTAVSAVAALIAAIAALLALKR